MSLQRACLGSALLITACAPAQAPFTAYSLKGPCAVWVTFTRNMAAPDASMVAFDDPADSSDSIQLNARDARTLASTLGGAGEVKASQELVFLQDAADNRLFRLSPLSETVGTSVRNYESGTMQFNQNMINVTVSGTGSDVKDGITYSGTFQWSLNGRCTENSVDE